MDSFFKKKKHQDIESSDLFDRSGSEWAVMTTASANYCRVFWNNNNLKFWWWEDSLQTNSAFFRDCERPTISVLISKMVIRQPTLFTFNCIHHLTVQSSTCDAAPAEALYLLFPQSYTSLFIFWTIYWKVPYIPWLQESCLPWGEDRKRRVKTIFEPGYPHGFPAEHRAGSKHYLCGDFSPCGAGTSGPFHTHALELAARLCTKPRTAWWIKQ